jgi:uncharacterized membrane protein YcaP (DUF421 family)
MSISWLTTSWTAVIMVVITSASIYTALIILTRIVGLKSFSKISTIDFAITVTIGALIARTVLVRNPPLLQGLVALGVLFLLQFILSWLRRNSLVRKLVDNKPLLLMKDSEMLEDNLNKARVTPDDVRAKLREANVTHLSQVKAVVMETTGDISVMHNDSDLMPDEELLTSVEGWGN